MINFFVILKVGNSIARELTITGARRQKFIKFIAYYGQNCDLIHEVSFFSVDLQFIKLQDH